MGKPKEKFLKKCIWDGKYKGLLAKEHIVVGKGLRELMRREVDMEVVGEAGDREEEVVRLVM